MKKTKLLIFTLLIAIISFPAFAGQWSEATSINKIYPQSINNTDGTIYFTFEIMLNPSSCSRSSLIALKKNNKVSAEIYSLLLTAFTTNSKITYYVDGCDEKSYPVMVHAMINR